jgi:hypothetical protein
MHRTSEANENLGSAGDRIFLSEKFSLMLWGWAESSELVGRRPAASGVLLELIGRVGTL